MEKIEFENSQRLSHAYILTARSREACFRGAKELAMAAVCSCGGKVPCGVCRDCKKAAADIHPDIFTVECLTDDKGKAKKEIAVDQIREIIADSYVLPNEAGRKVYIIRDGDLMNVSAQNAALKLLEEPPKTVILIIATVNSQQLLPTVRSRCVQLEYGGDEAEDNPLIKPAEEYLKIVAHKDETKLCSFCFKNEGMDTAGAGAFADCVADVCADILAGRRKADGLSNRQLLYTANLMNRCKQYLKVNTGVKHIFGLLAVKSIVGEPDEKGQTID